MTSFFLVTTPILLSPEFFDFAALSMCRPRAPSIEVEHLLSNGIAQHCMAPVALTALPMLDNANFGQIFDNDYASDMAMLAIHSDQVGKAFFHASKPLQAEPQKKHSDTNARG